MAHPSVESGLARLPALPPATRPLTNAQLRWLEAQQPNLNPGPVRCITCGGRRTFRWWIGGRAEVVQYACPCDDQYILHLRLLYAGIGLSYQRLAWADFFDQSGEHIKVAEEYLDHARQFVTAGIGLLVHGTRGTGKSMLAALIVKELVCQRGVDAMSITFASLLQGFSGGWKDPELAAWWASRIRNAGVLLVNDVGREHQGGRSIADSTLEELLRHRGEASLPTIITSNLRPEELTTYYGQHTASLLTESMLELEFRGADRRHDVKVRITDEIRQGLDRPVVIA